jgi:hypothetical protein
VRELKTLGGDLMPAEELKAVVHRIVEALNEGNWGALDELYTVNLVCHRPPYPDIKDLKSYKQ